MNTNVVQEGALQRILYVDDDEDMQLIVEVALAGFGNYSVGLCSSWCEAREKIADFKPDLILLDVMMPDTDGLSALREIQEHEENRHIPVVFLTAHLNPQQLTSATDLGILGILAKPFKPDQLAAQLREMWQKSGRPLQ